MVIRKRILGLMLATACSLGATAALAADYEPPVFEAPAEDEYVPVEVGSGWYLRGDVGYTSNEPYKREYSGSIPGATFSDEFKPFSASLGAGYHFNDFLRVEANLGTLPSGSERFAGITDAGTATEASVAGAADNKAYFGMVSAYADFGTFSGLTPYLGGGIGLAHYKYEGHESTNYADPGLIDTVVVNEKRGYAFAYSLGAGVAYNVSQNVALDVGYQYFSAPDAERFALLGPGSNVEKGIDYHTVKVGLRYDLW